MCSAASARSRCTTKSSPACEWAANAVLSIAAVAPRLGQGSPARPCPAPPSHTRPLTLVLAPGRSYLGGWPESAGKLPKVNQLAVVDVTCELPKMHPHKYLLLPVWDTQGVCPGAGGGAHDGAGV